VQTKVPSLFAIDIVTVATVAMLLLSSCARPPNDASLAQQFYANQTAFAELKQMLEVDSRLQQVAEFGVCTTNSLVATTPAVAGLSTERYQKYLSLLHQAGARGAIHDETEFRFLIAASGFASNGYRIALTWRATKPDHVIASLDDFRKTSSEWEQAYRPLGENWYLWIIW
jgi:hypothetical protein